MRQNCESSVPLAQIKSNEVEGRPSLTATSQPEWSEFKTES